MNGDKSTLSEGRSMFIVKRDLGDFENVIG